jgi:hypothetical protein
MLQSLGEHQEVPKAEAAVRLVGALRTRRRERILAAERSQKPKVRVQASCESRKRLTVADRKVSRRARMAWRKRGMAQEKPRQKGLHLGQGSASNPGSRAAQEESTERLDHTDAQRESAKSL